jgi:hypothetical protein
MKKSMHPKGSDKHAIQRKLTTLTLANIPEEEKNFHGDTFLAEFIRFSEQEIEPNWVNFMVGGTMGFVAIAIGFMLSIGPLFIITQFNQSSTFVGILLAASSGVSAIYAVITSKLNKGCQKKYNSITYKNPYNFVGLYFGIGISVVGISLSPFYLCMFFFFTLVVFNDLASLRLNMILGQTTSIFAYKKVCPMAQVCRRFLNAVTAVTGPLLFSIYPPLPFIFAGGLTTLWTAFLIVAFRRRHKTLKEMIKENILSQHGDGDNSCVFHIASYPLQEILGQLITYK